MKIFSKENNLKFLETINKKTSLKRYMNLLVGSFLVALSYNLFLAPNDLVPGGVSGIAIILNHIFGIDNAIIMTRKI